MHPIRFLPLLLLAACATPVERCVTQATEGLRAAEAELRTLEATLARGYAVEERVRSHPVFTTCGFGPERRPCVAERVVRVPRKVPVNLVEVRRRADELRARLPELQRSADAGAGQCRAAYAAAEARP
ncbi:hypothetical protein [Roseivivax sp. CAU 1761]